MRLSTLCLAAFSAAVVACGRGGDENVREIAPVPIDKAVLLAATIEGPHRTPEERARDVWRNPAETLSFFGVAPDMTVVEVWPGGGWYTKILAPYLRAGGGVYYAAQVDPRDGGAAAEAVSRFKAEYSDPALYGEIRVTTLGAGPVAPDGTADVVLTFRNVHNWIAAGVAADHFASFYRALRPGGVLGVVDHRAEEDMAETKGATGYVKESTVKALAEAVGFEFVASAEINANPNDTKDHPFGVWTLPPVRRSGAVAGIETPGFDPARYEAIGESDRMTLKFRKPVQ
jgi:predicted methyltransferase